MQQQFGDLQNKVQQYEEAIFNLSQLLTNASAFQEINRQIFEACDTRNTGNVGSKEVLEFTQQLLLGIAFTDEDSFAQQQRAQSLCAHLLTQNQYGHITQDQVTQFLQELIKDQIKELQESKEKAKKTSKL